MARKLSDWDQNLKVRHLGEKSVTLTVQHVGIKKTPKQAERVVILAGGDLPEQDYDETIYLFWKEHGSKFPLKINNTNREFLIKKLGDTSDWAQRLIGMRVVLENQTKMYFGKNKTVVSIVNLLPAETKGQQAAPSPAAIDVETGEVLDETPAPPPVDVGVNGRGTVVASHDSLAPLVAPPASLWAAVERARKSGAAFKTAESQENGRGMLVSVLDDYAGDTQRRHSFLSALFPYSKGASKNLSAADLRALLTWKDATDARSEVNRVVADYLKAQGQTEMQLAA